MENSKIKRIQSANQKISSAISSLETLKLENIDAAKKIDDIMNAPVNRIKKNGEYRLPKNYIL